MDASRVGVDLVEVPRFAETIRTVGAAFLDRHFTTREQATCRGSAQRLAARFAAKEAVGKAMGTGIPGALSRQIEVVTDPSGVPSVVLHGEAAAASRAAGIVTWAVSLSHTEQLAIAVVIGRGGTAG